MPDKKQPPSISRRTIVKAATTLLSSGFVLSGYWPVAESSTGKPGRSGGSVLVTGGAGYIGSHTCVELLQAGYDVIVLDNLSNSSREALRRVQGIAGRELLFIFGDIRDRILLDRLFSLYPIDAVIHFAGLKAVAESVSRPQDYYNNNVCGSNTLFEAMLKAGVNKIVFSSSATVYGQQEQMPIAETASLSHSSPYGHTKLMIEEMLGYIQQAAFRRGENWCVALLRYFNPIGAHKSGYIGEAPQGTPNNLMPYITQVAVGIRPYLRVFEGYRTGDGTGVRDYIHVVDLARGHIKALEKLQRVTGVHAWNLGVGEGFSVYQVVAAFERENHLTIPIKREGRREGDVDVCFADVTKAEQELGWKAELGLADMVRDSYNWQQHNPHGYG